MGIADAYMQHGADVVIISRRQDRLDVASKELEGSFPTVLGA
jgi:short-subunit dehydrogenase